MNNQYEIWKDIENYENLYQVSNFGNVRRLPVIINAMSRWGTIRKMKFKGKNIKTCHKSGSGYPIVSLCKNGVSKIYSVHRLVAKAFIENVNNLPQVNHKDGNKINNNFNNLEWVSKSDNMLHSFHELKNQKINRKKVIDTSTGIVYESILDLSKKLNIKYTTIARKLAGTLKNNTNIKYEL
jgi:hypothetical protein